MRGNTTLQYIRLGEESFPMVGEQIPCILAWYQLKLVPGDGVQHEEICI